MLTIPKSLTNFTDHKPLTDKAKNGYGDSIDLRAYDLDDEMLAAVLAAATRAAAESEAKGIVTEAKRAGRVAEAIIAARAGDVKRAIPSLPALPEMLLAYLRNNLSDGWVYKRGSDDHLHPWLVTGVTYEEPSRDRKASVTVSLIANGGTGGNHSRSKVLGPVQSSIHFSGETVARKRISDVLTAEGVYIETDALRAGYDEAIEHYRVVMADGFSEQFIFTGTAYSTDSWRDNPSRARAKVIHDVMRNEVAPTAEYADSALFADPANDEKKRRKGGAVVAATDVGDEEFPGVGPVPTHTLVQVFDLGTHKFMWVNANDLVRYQYDKTLATKIVLPEDQRNLLDILTTNLDDFTGDVIEGKSAGNVILGKGVPGVGKTLTAEVYSELIERPLYSIHSGNLGITAKDVRENLETTFERSKRWNAVLLLDEADVFVLERGSNITQNAIVAEFLRALEYFTGLMFMTTNRANNIDDAILSRAAAIIDYTLPDKAGIRAVWEVQAANQSTTIEADLLDALVDGFAVIAPRDVKMLLRLALRVAKGNGHDLDVETFQRCAMFRGLHFEKGSRA